MSPVENSAHYTVGFELYDEEFTSKRLEEEEKQESQLATRDGLLKKISSGPAHIITVVTDEFDPTCTCVNAVSAHYLLQQGLLFVSATPSKNKITITRHYDLYSSAEDTTKMTNLNNLTKRFPFAKQVSSREVVIDRVDSAANLK